VLFIESCAISLIQSQKTFHVTDDEATVAWKDAVTYLTSQLKIMRSTQKRDLWVNISLFLKLLILIYVLCFVHQIGLNDFTAQQRYFWYNIRDDTSFWMSAEEQEQYILARRMLINPDAENLPLHWLVPMRCRETIAQPEPDKTPKNTTKKLQKGRRRRATFEDDTDSSKQRRGSKAVRDSGDFENKT
jgi:hypothetical protein